jgi:shikimate dehydrogenase
MAAERRRAAVIGHPVAHSRSPAMHNAAYAATGLPWRYEAIDVPPGELAAFVSGLPASPYAGVNVTIPHKVAAAELCDDLSAEAREAGSVNTIVVGPDGRLEGHSTDGRGLLWALGDEPPADALVLGAGGSARAVVAALRGAGWTVRVSARRPEAAAALGDAAPWPPDAAAALVVNATPLGQAETPGPGSNVSVPIDTKLLGPSMIVADLAYRGDGAETALIAASRAAGCRVVDGIDVLVGQGILAFELLTGRTAPVEIMHFAARRETLEPGPGVSRGRGGTAPDR